MFRSVALDPHDSGGLLTMQTVLSAAVSFILLLVVHPVPAAEPFVVEIWPGDVPDESAEIGAERVRMSPKLDRKQVEVIEPSRLITNVSRPTITIYHPAPEKGEGRAPGRGRVDRTLQDGAGDGIRANTRSGKFRFTGASMSGSRGPTSTPELRSGAVERQIGHEAC